MKNCLKFILLMVFVAGSLSCQKKVDTTAADPVWDRQICDQCKMILSNRNFATQIINLETGKRLYFDDLGCALRYLATNKQTLSSDKIVIYATDAQTGKWLDLKDSHIVQGFVTPMSSSLGVLSTDKNLPKDKKKISFEDAYKSYEKAVHK